MKFFVDGFNEFVIYMDHHEGFFIGLFTFLLCASTTLLWRSTEKLWSAGEKQIAIAEQAADAAKRSADTAVDVELPILHIEKLTSVLPCEEDIGQWVRDFIPRLAIRNYGRTPAFVNETLINVEIAPFLPDFPVYRIINEYPDEFVIDQKDRHIHEDYLLSNSFDFSDRQISDLSLDEDKSFLFVFGNIKYRDIWNNNHQYGFIFCWVLANKNFIEIQNYSHYLYRRKIAD